MTEEPASIAARFREALAALPWSERRVFVLHAVDGLDYAAIAARLLLSVFDVEELLARALVLLDRHLSAGETKPGSVGNGA